jgi:hypothetical protein
MPLRLFRLLPCGAALRPCRATGSPVRCGGRCRASPERPRRGDDGFAAAATGAARWIAVMLIFFLPGVDFIDNRKPRGFVNSPLPVNPVGDGVWRGLGFRFGNSIGSSTRWFCQPALQPRHERGRWFWRTAQNAPASRVWPRPPVFAKAWRACMGHKLLMAACRNPYVIPDKPNSGTKRRIHRGRFPRFEFLPQVFPLRRYWLGKCDATEREPLRAAHQREGQRVPDPEEPRPFEWSL